MKVRFTETALVEIDEIVSYIAAHIPRAADAVKARLQHTIGLIGQFPEIGPVKYREFVRMLPFRRYPQYLVFYAIDEADVIILNVRHGARRRPWEDER